MNHTLMDCPKKLDCRVRRKIVLEILSFHFLIITVTRSESKQCSIMLILSSFQLYSVLQQVLLLRGLGVEVQAISGRVFSGPAKNNKEVCFQTKQLWCSNRRRRFISKEKETISLAREGPKVGQ